MGKNWRPDNWRNLYFLACVNNPRMDLEMKACSDAYEAGADAMLDAIRKQDSIGIPFTMAGEGVIFSHLKGRLYFIPDGGANATK